MGLFPGAIISIEGKIETWLKDRSALDVEQKFKEELKQSRLNRLSDPNDIPGPHRSEFNCLHSVNKMEASSCSTGEQKALLISIILSHAILRKQDFGSAPILLLDEIEKVILSGSYIQGSLVSKFENSFLSFLGNKGQIVSCANGTDAITIALLSYRAKPRSLPWKGQCERAARPDAGCSQEVLPSRRRRARKACRRTRVDIAHRFLAAKPNHEETE